MSEVLKLAPFAHLDGYTTNTPTQDAYDHLSSEDWARERLEALADTPDFAEASASVREWFAARLDRFLKGAPLGVRDDAFLNLMRWWAQAPMIVIPWQGVIGILDVQFHTPHEPVLYHLLAILRENQQYRHILANCAEGQDTCLRKWTHMHCLIWADNREARRYKGPIHPFAEALIQHYANAVDWADVTSRFRRDDLPR